MSRFHRYAACIVVLMAASSGIVARQRPEDLDQTLRAMSKGSREARHDALRSLAAQLRAEPAIATREDVQLAVARLLDAENRRHGYAPRNPYSEDSEPDVSFYHYELMPTAVALVPQAVPAAQPALVSAVVTGAYSTGSKLAEIVGAVGEGAMPTILRLSGSARASQRSQAYDLLGQTLARHRARAVRRPLTLASEAAARRTLLNGLRDVDIVCRREAVRSVERAGLREAVPVLRELAATDPDGPGSNGPFRFSVRGLATKAIATLSQEP